MLFAALVVAGQHGAGGQAVNPRGRIALGHSQHLHRAGKGVLGHGVAEEIRVRIGDLHVEELDHPLAAQRPGIGQKCLGHPRRGLRVDPHRLGKDRGIDRFGRIGPKDGGAIDQHPPVFKPRCQILDHVERHGAVDQIAGHHFGRGQRCGQFAGGAGRMAGVDHHMPAGMAKAPRQYRADPPGRARYENRWSGHPPWLCGGWPARSRVQRQRVGPLAISLPSSAPAAAPRIVPVVRSPRVSMARPSSAPSAAPTSRPTVPSPRRQ